MTTPLEKVLRLASEAPVPEPDEFRLLVQAAHVALTGACGSDDPATAAELIYSAAARVEKLASMLFTESLPADQVAASMVSTPDGSLVGLSVLTAEGRRRAKAAGYTIAGSDDYPIPDKDHLSAAIARYKEGKLAGHPASVVKAHILKHARRLGVEVSLTAAPVLAQIRDGEATVFLAAAPPSDVGGVPMHHAPFNGTHSHAHTVMMTHGHEHSHAGDSSHSSAMHGQNPGQKAWTPKGQASSSRYDY